jgi:hypothetical protein
MLVPVRSALLPIALILASCAAPPRPVETPKPDVTLDPAYGQTIGQLNALTLAAEKLLQNGQAEKAGALVVEAQPLLTRLLSATHPTLEAMQAVSDSDRLYCRMLLANRHYGWARLLFQKEVTRWKTWQPQTADTALRLKTAIAGLAECDRRLQE